MIFRLVEAKHVTYVKEGQDTDIVDLIKRKCKPFLKEAHINPNLPFEKWPSLYRGSDTDIDHYRIIPVRTNRRPLNSSKAEHNAFMRAIEAVGGVATRTNSVFVTGDYSTAEEYGRNVYRVFPIGEFYYTYAEGIKDWLYNSNMEPRTLALPRNEANDAAVLELYHSKDPRLQQLRKAWDGLDVDKVVIGRFILFDESMTADNIPTDISDEARILLTHALRLYHEYTKHPDKMIAHQLQPLIRCDDGNLGQAMSKGYEIMIHCNEVILVATNEDDYY